MSETVHSSLKTIVKGTTAVFLGSVVSFVLWFVTKVLIVRNISAEEFGLFSLAVAVVSVLSEIAILGLHSASTRFVSMRLGEGRRDEADLVARNSLNLGLISGMAFFAILFLSSGFVARDIFFKPEFEAPLRAISFFVPVYVIAQIAASILRGHKIITPKIYYLDIGFPLFYLVFLGAIFALGLSYISVVYAYMLSMVIVLASIGISSYRTIRLNIIALTGEQGRMKLMRFSLPILVGSTLAMILYWADTLILGRYASVEVVGAYNISITFARFLLFPAIAVDFIFMPVIGAIYANNQMAELKRTYQVITKWVFSASLPLFFLVLCFPDTIITFVFGNRFADSALPLRILSLGFMFQVFLGSTSVLMVVLGMLNEVMIAAAFGGVLDILLNYLLIKHLGYGAVGASIATAISYIVVNALSMFLIYRRSGLHPFVKKYLLSYAAAALIGAAIFALSRVLPLHWWMLPPYFLLFVCGFFASMLLTKNIDSEDIEMLDAISARMGFEMRAVRAFLLRFVG